MFFKRKVSSLLEAIVTDPLATAPRLALASAILERDQPRAWFIRLQVHRLSLELADPADCSEIYETLRMEDRLLALNEARWQPPFGLRTARWGFSRGFPEWLSIDAPTFIDHASRIRAKVPLLAVKLTRASEELPALAASGVTKGIQALDLRGNHLDDAALCALLAEAPLEDLVWLELSNNRLGEACLEALASSQRLPVLACLGFQGNKAPDPTWRVYDDPLGGVASVQPQGAGEALQSRFGPKAWLSRPRFELQHPPPALFYPYGNDLQPQAVQS
jgi:uncharacterized protein (TIGR02996 family)